MTFGLTASGYTAPRQADFLVRIRTSFTTRLVALGFTDTPDYERDTFLGQITEIMAFELGQLAEANQLVYDARSVGNAVGLQLDNLALIVGVVRQEATKGTVTLTCTGTDGAEITQGKIVQGGGDDGKALWIISEDVVIGAVTPGTVDVVAKAEFAGVVVATIGQVDTIVTTVDGWDAVTNVADANPGQARETNGELRARRQRALQAAGGTSTNAILGGLLGLDFVTGAAVIDNPTDVPGLIDGVVVAKYAVAAVVAPDTMTTEQQQLVVQDIFDHLGGGTATSGTESGTVTKRDGRSHPINFSFAVSTPVPVVWTLEMEEGFVPADVDEDLEALVTDFFLTLGPGSTVYPTPLIALAATITGIANVTTLLLAGAEDPVTHTIVEQPTLGTHTVT